MNPIEWAVSLLAPHQCISCRNEGDLLCVGCALIVLEEPPPACYYCRSPTVDSATCIACTPFTSLEHVWAGSLYTGTAKELVAALKFQRAKAAAFPIAQWLDYVLPDLSPEAIITTVPTADVRVRARGYDQARLIAKHLARRRGLRYADLLYRVGSTRQVGATRQERFDHLHDAFMPRNRALIDGSHILLVDDVLTTGATLTAAARLMKLSGAVSVNGAVFARSD